MDDSLVNYIIYKTNTVIAKYITFSDKLFNKLDSLSSNSLP